MTFTPNLTLFKLKWMNKLKKQQELFPRKLSVSLCFRLVCKLRYNRTKKVTQSLVSRVGQILPRKQLKMVPQCKELTDCVTYFTAR